jgi:hypothetical protein
MVDRIGRVVGKVLVFILRPIAYAMYALRVLSRWVLLQTNADLFLARKNGTLAFRVVRHKRKPFVIVGGEVMGMQWNGKDTAVSLDIPDEVSLDTAKALLTVQQFDPWIAEQAFIALEVVQ